MIDKTKAKAWANTVGDWVGDSPYKALTFGAVVFVLGVAAGAWVF